MKTVYIRTKVVEENKPNFYVTNNIGNIVAKVKPVEVEEVSDKEIEIASYDYEDSVKEKLGGDQSHCISFLKGAIFMQDKLTPLLASQKAEIEMLKKDKEDCGGWVTVATEYSLKQKAEIEQLKKDRDMWQRLYEQNKPF